MSLRLRAARWALKAAGISDTQLAQVFGASQSQRARMGTQDLLKGFGTMPWLRAVVGKVGFATAAVPWELYAVKSKGAPKATRHRTLQRSMDPIQRRAIYKELREEDSLKEITDHPALDLFDHGNDQMVGLQVRELTQEYLDLAGECLWVLDTNGLKVPTAIWPVPPTWIGELPTARKPSFGVQMPAGYVTVPVEDTIYFRQVNPADPYQRGIGIGHSLGDELETDELAAKYLKSWFYNKARPDILVTGEQLKEPDLKRLEEKWLEKLGGGPRTANKPFFINRNIKVDILSQSFQEMQMSQLRKDERDAIIQVYGVPPEVFGILESSNRATIDAADYMMAKYVMVPRLELQRIILQQRLIERFDDRLILDYCTPVMEDKEYELKVMTANPSAFTVDEWREAGGRKPLEGGVGEGHIVAIAQSYTESLDDLVASDEPLANSGDPAIPPSSPPSGPGNGPPKS